MKILGLSIDCISIVLICYCLFAEYQKDEWNQHLEKGIKTETTVYHRISTSQLPDFAKSANTFFVKSADANYHPKEIFMDLPAAIILIVALSMYFRREFF